MDRQILGRIFWWKVFIAACLIRLNEDDGLEAQAMRLSITFSAYVGRQFLFWFFSVVLILAAIILLFDFVELIRRTSKHEEATPDIALFMALLRLPIMIEPLEAGFEICLFGPSPMQPHPLLRSLSYPFLKLFI